ncbi:elongation factor P maturation arginine rhamnosyltransferase EarP [Alishewanella sp. d11]|uniref:elongation factor P maturation arginine rhamnosyltransferase EarP n=1 Tax=Alishewanella sp. d11 TaxID=3414030 RepID=UPI003BF7DB70
MQQKRPQWDIFCAVVDNFGDIGICWRLSKQLAAEHGIVVRLWVDDLVSFQRLCPEIDPALAVQYHDGVDIWHWHSVIDWPTITVASVVIEALACTIPEAYQQQMAACTSKPLWLNLEYLSAESWVDGCHGMASPHPQLPLTKYFFFPGFTANTGGLLREQPLLAQLADFAADQTKQQQFWQQLGLPNAQDFGQRISLFAYSHTHLASLLHCWQHAEQTTLCVIPIGTLAEQVQALLPELTVKQSQRFGALTIKILPFLPQPDYDLLLSACDVNFVRGEDSIIRAQWAAKPFVWQIYRQTEDAHLLKLQAFLQRYTADWPPSLAQVVVDFHLAWNSEQPLAKSWQQFSHEFTLLAEKNLLWRNKLESHGDLASNLVRFVEKKIIM